MKEGRWVVIQNCHLLKDAFKYLDVLLNKVDTTSGVHQQFKLWIVTYPLDDLPVTVLLKGILRMLE